MWATTPKAPPPALPKTAAVTGSQGAASLDAARAPGVDVDVVDLDGAADRHELELDRGDREQREQRLEVQDRRPSLPRGARRDPRDVEYADDLAEQVPGDHLDADGAAIR